MAMRAVSFNLNSAKLMGINTDAIISLTFAIGSALAAAGGVLTAQYNPNIDPLMGILTGLKAFVAAVLGGEIPLAGRRVAVILSGANIDADRLRELLEGSYLWRPGAARNESRSVSGFAL